MQTVVIDNKNPRINYTTGWYDADGVHATDYNQTVTISGGPSAGFSFQFTGTSISVYGSIPPNNTASSTYTIDTSTPAGFTNPNSTGPYKSGQLLYQSPALADGEHTLSVAAPDTVVGDPSTQFYFDYLTYVPSSAGAVAAAPRNRVGVLLPAVLVPVVVLVAALAGALWWRRQRRHAAPTVTPLRNEEGYLAENKFHSTFKITPLPPPPPSAHDLRDTVSDFAFPSSPVTATAGAPSLSMATAVPPPSVRRAKAPPGAFPPDAMLAATRARRLERFDGASTRAGSVRTADVPPTYRSRG